MEYNGQQEKEADEARTKILAERGNQPETDPAGSKTDDPQRPPDPPPKPVYMKQCRRCGGTGFVTGGGVVGSMLPNPRGEMYQMCSNCRTKYYMDDYYRLPEVKIGG
jgi:hypothetical protein